MTRFVIALILLLAGAKAMPQQEIQDAPVDERIVGDIVAGILETVSQQIKDAGYDPYNLKYFAFQFNLPVPVLFNHSTQIENVEVSGVSNIVINNINYSLLSGRLQLDISLPKLSVALGDAAVDTTVLGSKLNANFQGRLAIIEPRISGEVRVSIGLSGISVREVNLEFDLGGIEYEGTVNVLGYDLSDYVSDLANNKIPAQIKEYRNEINEMIEILVWQVINQIL